jgi:hypothetical protein
VRGNPDNNDENSRPATASPPFESFPVLPGEHLSWRQTARGVSEIATQDWQVLATVEGLRLFPPWPLVPRPPRRVKIGQQIYPVKGRMVNARVASADGQEVLWFTGTKNFNLRAKAVAHLPDGRTLRFPVEGTSRRNAVMTAVDDSGRPVFRIRKVRSADRGKRVEILVEPGLQVTDELLLAIATGYYNLDSFFDRGSGA